jgi:hypothetical protein
LRGPGARVEPPRAPHGSGHWVLTGGKRGNHGRAPPAGGPVRAPVGTQDGRCHQRGSRVASKFVLLKALLHWGSGACTAAPLFVRLCLCQMCLFAGDLVCMWYASLLRPLMPVCVGGGAASLQRGTKSRLLSTDYRVPSARRQA